jgi:hypothetical protein
MNGEQLRQINGVVQKFGYEVNPLPEGDKEVTYFDITSEGGAIQPARVLNALHEATAGTFGDSLSPKLLSAQPHCLTFEDVKL